MGAGLAAWTPGAWRSGAWKPGAWKTRGAPFHPGGGGGGKGEEAYHYPHWREEALQRRQEADRLALLARDDAEALEFLEFFSFLMMVDP